MLRKLRPRSIYDVMAAIGCFAALATGTAYAANTVFSTDIVDGQVKSVDIGNNEIGSADVKDNSLNTFDVHSFIGADVVDGTLEDQDVGQGAFVAFNAFIGQGGDIHAHSCETAPITGINAQGDHLLLTANAAESGGGLIHTIEYQPGTESALLKSCNITGSNIEGPIEAHFNLLVFDAQ